MIFLCRHLLVAVALLCLTGAARAAAPTVTTDPAMFVDAYRVHLEGTLTLNGENATAWFEYGPTITYGTKTLATAYTTGMAVDVAVVNLKEQTPYHFRFAAKTATGAIVYGADATFTTTTAFPVGIDAQPVAPYVLTTLGQKGVTLAITGHGSSAQYQWLHNNVAIPLAVYETYKLPTISSTTLSGTYRCRVSNPRGTIYSDSVTLAIATISPAVLTSVNEGGAFSLATTLWPANPAATYQWSGSSHPSLAGIGTVTGATAAKLSVSQVSATAGDGYKCEVTAGGEMVTVGPVGIAVRLKPVVMPVAAQEIEVGQSLDIPLISSATPATVSVTASGLPPGFACVYNTPGKRYDITGRALASSTKPWTPVIVARNVAGAGVPVTFSFTVHPIDPLVSGTFNALVDRGADPGGNNFQGGAISNLVISSTGAMTGKLVLGSIGYPFTGLLGTTYGGTAAQYITIKRTLPLKNLGLAISINPADGHLTGSLQEEAGTAGTAAIDGWRNPFSTASPATRFAATPINFWMDPPAGLVAGTAPQGAGIGTIKMTTLGVATVVINLADGTPAITLVTTTGPHGDLGIHAGLYAGHGALHGPVVVLAQPAGTLNTITGSLTWNKTGAASASDHSYTPAGFDLGVADGRQALTVLGSEQTVQKGVILWGLGDVTSTPGVPNAQLTFSGGDIESAADAGAANEAFALSPAYGVAFTLPNIAGETLSVSGTTARFSGTFTLRDGMPEVARKVIFQGLTAPGQRRGRGFFTLVKLPVAPLTLATSPVLSGAVDFAGVR